jgi:hypothetical protein
MGNEQVSTPAAMVRVLFHGVVVTSGAEAPAVGAVTSSSAAAPAGIKKRVKRIRPPLEHSSVRSFRAFDT